MVVVGRGEVLVVTGLLTSQQETAAAAHVRLGLRLLCLLQSQDLFLLYYWLQLPLLVTPGPAGSGLLGYALSYRSLSLTLPSGLLLRHYPVLLVVLGDGQLLRPMLGLAVKVEIAVSSATESTELALERLQLLVNSSAMVLQFGGNEKHLSAEITGEGLVLDVNHFDVDFQIVFVVERLATVRAYKYNTAVIFLVMEVQFTAEFEDFVTFVTQEGRFAFIVDFILVAF